MACAIRTAICRHREQAAKAVSALRSRRPLSRAVQAWRRPRCQGWPMLRMNWDGAAAISAGHQLITANGTTDLPPLRASTTIGTELRPALSSATASATTATSEASWCTGFGSHPSEGIGLGASARVRIVMRGRKDAANGEVLVQLPCGVDAIAGAGETNVHHGERQAAPRRPSRRLPRRSWPGRSPAKPAAVSAISVCMAIKKIVLDDENAAGPACLPSVGPLPAGRRRVPVRPGRRRKMPCALLRRHR